jgi:hypothetical protein
MTKEQAEEIKTTIDELNKLYHPLTLSFDMYRNPKEDHDDNWFVTIVYNVVPEEFMAFVSLGFNFEMVSDKLSGFQFALESVLVYQEEHGNLKFSQSYMSGS